MSRYPFQDYAEEYMNSMRGIYADETWKNRMRRYRRMDTCIRDLKEKKKISTASPRTMTAEDVRIYLIERKSMVSPSDLVHDVNALRKLFAYVDNPAVELCLNKNPGLKPRAHGRNRKPSMSDEIYDMILKSSAEIDPTNFTLVRAYALVLICLRTGCRNKEIRFANVEDLNTTTWILNIIHVKGEASYGQPREVPVHPDVHRIILNYLLARQKWMLDNSCCSPALFPSNESEDGYLSGNAIRRIKVKVEEDLKIKFDLRECRRTFGQKYMDDGLDLESTSVLMGHSSTKTTEGFYSRKKLNRAIESAKGTW